MSRYINYKWWIFNKDKKPLYYQDGTVQAGSAVTLLKADGQPAFLNDSPTGWRETLVKYARNAKYMGMFREYTVPVTFTGDGLKILKALRSSEQGFETECFIGISKIDRTTWPVKYSDWYFGEIDLSKQKVGSDEFTVSITEGGPSKYLKAYENTEYELPIGSDPEAKNLYFDGKPFNKKIEYTVYEKQEIDGQFYYLGMGIVVEEGSSQGMLFQDQQLTTGSSFPNEEWFGSDVSKILSVNIRGTINVRIRSEAYVLPLRVKKVKTEGSSSTITDYELNTANLTVGDHSIPFDIDVPMLPGERIYLQTAGKNIGSGTIWMEILPESNLIVEFETIFDPTYAKAYTAKQLGDKLVNKMTEGRFLFKSSFLQGRNDILFSSGQAIRNFNNNEAKLKFSFENFFKSLKQFSVGVGIEGEYIVLEHISYFFRSHISMNLGKVARLTYSVAEDLVFNTIKAGYNNYTYDNVNGLDEFNVPQNWKLPITKIPKEYDLISPARADMTGIELTRLALYGKDSTDSASDNDVFMINAVQGGNFRYFGGAFEVISTNTIRIANTLPVIVAGSVLTATDSTINGAYTVVNTSLLEVGYTRITVLEPLTNGDYTGNLGLYSDSLYLLNRPAYSAITGVTHPTKVFNVEFSPKSGLLNNGALFHSMVEYEAGTVEFTAGEKNSELSRTLAGVTITEKANITVADFPARLFLPYYPELEAVVTDGFMTTMRDDPYGLIQVEYKGNQYYGYLWDGGIKPADLDVGKFKLLCGPLTDLSKL